MPYRILIQKSTNTLTLYQDSQVVKEYPVATGVERSLTPEGTFPIVLKIQCPAWTSPATGVTIPGCAPENPLGTRWLGLGVGGTQGRTYGVHGTNRPESIGTYISHGCVRMHNEDVEELDALVEVGTEVTIVW